MKVRCAWWRMLISPPPPPAPLLAADAPTRIQGEYAVVLKKTATDQEGLPEITIGGLFSTCVSQFVYTGSLRIYSRPYDYARNSGISYHISKAWRNDIPKGSIHVKSTQKKIL